MFKLIGTFSFIGAAVVLLAACDSDPSPTPATGQSSTVQNVVLLCSGGLDRERRVMLGAELERRGGNLNASYIKLVRNAILAMVKDLEIPEGDRADAAIDIQKQYLDCVGRHFGVVIEETREERERSARAQCLAGCCDAFDCEDDCPMTTYRNISYPSGEGNSCREYTTYEFGCRWNGPYYYCQNWPVRVSYRKMRSCMSDCPQFN